jgi:hypothetical protein
LEIENLKVKENEVERTPKTILLLYNWEIENLKLKSK